MLQGNYWPSETTPEVALPYMNHKKKKTIKFIRQIWKNVCTTHNTVRQCQQPRPLREILQTTANLPIYLFFSSTLGSSKLKTKKTNWALEQYTGWAPLLQSLLTTSLSTTYFLHKMGVLNPRSLPMTN